MKITVHATYYAGTATEIDIDADWKDVDTWWIKWDTFHYTLKGSEEEHSVEMNNSLEDTVDWKRPVASRVANENGVTLDKDDE